MKKKKPPKSDLYAATARVAADGALNENLPLPLRQVYAGYALHYDKKARAEKERENNADTDCQDG